MLWTSHVITECAHCPTIHTVLPGSSRWHGAQHTGCEFTAAQEHRQNLDGLSFHPAASACLCSEDQGQRKPVWCGEDFFFLLAPRGSSLYFTSCVYVWVHLSMCCSLIETSSSCLNPASRCSLRALAVHGCTYKRTHCAYAICRNTHPHSHLLTQTHTLPARV